MSIDKHLLTLLEFDTNQTWVNPKTGNRVGYYRAMKLGLIKPDAGTPSPSQSKPNKIKPVKKVTKGHATGPRPKKDPNAPKAWWADFTKYKLNAYPVNIPQDQVKVNLSGDVNSHVVLQWKHPKTGKVISAYTQEFLKRNAEVKWKRITKIKPKDIKHIHDTANQILNNPSADDRLKQAAAIISIISHTGLRVGSTKGFDATGNRGVSTLSAENIKISGNNIKFNFVGKSYQDNEAEIYDPSLAKYLTTKKVERQNSPFLFSIPKNYIDEVYDQYMKMEAFKIKDLRTYVATSVAKKMLYDDPATPPPLPSNPKEIKTAVKNKLKDIFEKVSQILNNTPAMARTSYIHPKVINTWLAEIGVKPEYVGYNEELIKEDEFDDVINAALLEDEFDDVDLYPLPDWWDDDNIDLVPIR